MKLAGIVPLFLTALGSAAASCDVDLFKTVGVIAPSDDAINILKQENSSVTFKVSNKWVDHAPDMDYVFVQYNDPVTGSLRCVSYADVAASWTSAEFKTGCMVNRRLSVVTVHVADAAFLGGNAGSLPNCCGDDSTLIDRALESNSNSVSYTYILECAPVSCIPEDCKTPEDPPAAYLADPPAYEKELIVNNDKVKQTTWVEVPDGQEPEYPTCACADKSVDMVAGDGFVTGGGWIYMDPENFYVDTAIVGTTFAKDTKANFGFNAKSKKGVPDGSTNFVIDGNAFHFHSGTGKIDYDFLEVPDGIRARWWGTGHLSTGAGNAAKGDVYSFLVAVQDWGEPGADDTWRIRIWETSSNKLVFDTNPNVPGMELTADSDPDNDRFLGTELGELDANGGGNIQIHRSKNGRAFMLESDVNCDCDPEKKIAPATAGRGAFVTGGGWVYLVDAIRNTTGTVEELNGNKANFGFNAKFKNKGNLAPDGSTNFDYEGNEFHFHSATGNVDFDFLEIPSPTEARWMGRGTLSLTAARRGLGNIQDTHGFMVAVQDNGEPGAADTWRLRIWALEDGELALNNDGLNPVVPAKYVFDTNPEFPTGYDDPSRFLGTELGELGSNGGGNVQIHWKK
jgi:hypothetical protein